MPGSKGRGRGAPACAFVCGRGKRLRGDVAIAGVLVALASLALCGRAAALTPNDPAFGLQWADENHGQSIPSQFIEGEEPLGPPKTGSPAPTIAPRKPGR